MHYEIDVTCYAGYRGNERPVKFTYQYNEFHIKKILDRSVRESPANRERICRFKVLCTDDKTYSIFYNFDQDQWFIEEKG